MGAIASPPACTRPARSRRRSGMTSGYSPRSSSTSSATTRKRNCAGASASRMFRMNGALLGMAAIDIYPANVPRPPARGHRHRARAAPRELARPEPAAEAGLAHLPRRAPAPPAAAYLLVLRHFQLQELPAAAAQFPRLLAALRRADAGTGSGAHRSAGHASRTGPPGGRRAARGALGPEAHARHRGTAGPRRPDSDPTWSFSRAPTRATPRATCWFACAP